MFNIHFSIERWKWNADFGLWVSNKGRFRSRDKRDLPINIEQSGYCTVYCGGTAHKHVKAHRVVMLTWRPTANAENLTIDHLDHNKRNNALDNLEWVTEAENQRRAQADFVSVCVEGNPDMVSKVDVSVVGMQSPPTRYPYYIRFKGGAVLSIEQVAELFFRIYGKNFKGPNNPCNTTDEFATAIHSYTSGNKTKLFGIEYKKINK
jgi:hypothetical protein